MLIKKTATLIADPSISIYSLAINFRNFSKTLLLLVLDALLVSPELDTIN